MKRRVTIGLSKFQEELMHADKIVTQPVNVVGRQNKRLRWNLDQRTKEATK